MRHLLRYGASLSRSPYTGVRLPRQSLRALHLTHPFPSGNLL